MKIVWLREASMALDLEYEFIFGQNPAAAKRVFERMIASTHRLSDFPESGRYGHVAGTRELVVPGLPHIVIYRINKNNVEILRVFGTARNWPEMFH
jgi:toxin ParE1/3/4